MVATTEQLVLLFKGDDASMGYAHPELVAELCCMSDKNVTPSYDWCWHLIYGDNDIPQEISKIIRSGVKLWYSRNRPRH